MGQQVLHRREEEAVIGGAGQHGPAAAEGLGDGVGDIDPGQVDLHHLRPLGPELFGQDVGGCAGVAVDGGTGDQHLLRLFGLIAGPQIVVVQVLAKVAGEDGAVERADGLDVQRSGLFQQSLHLRAVLAHDVQVVAAGLAGPVGLLVELCHRAEAAKAVGGEEDFFGGLIAHHDLGPVDHRREHESQGVSAQRKALAVLHDDAALLGDGLRAEELLHILEGLGVAHHLHLGVEGGEAGHIRAVVRLHVVDDEVGGLLPCQRLGDIRHPLVGSAGIHGVEDGGLLVPDDVRVVADAGGDRVLALKQIDGGIVHAHAQNGAADVLYAHKHISSLLLVCMVCHGRQLF